MKMMQIEGDWVGGKRRSRVPRREMSCAAAWPQRLKPRWSKVVTQGCVPPIFPPEHRVLLFAPEFGGAQSFDMDLWTYLEPEDTVDISVAGELFFFFKKKKIYWVLMDCLRCAGRAGPTSAPWPKRSCTRCWPSGMA